MAGRTFLRRRLVKQHRFAAYSLNILVAGFAAHILVRPSQGESSPLVIEQRGFPLKTIVTVGAGGHFACIRELRPMNVLVAFLAFGWSRFEVSLHQLGSHVRRLVAIDAGGTAMGAEQRERGPGVVKGAEVTPRFGVVTRAASSRCS